MPDSSTAELKDDFGRTHEPEFVARNLLNSRRITLDPFDLSPELGNLVPQLLLLLQEPDSFLLQLRELGQA